MTKEERAYALVSEHGFGHQPALVGLIFAALSDPQLVPQLLKVGLAQKMRNGRWLLIETVAKPEDLHDNGNGCQELYVALP